MQAARYDTIKPMSTAIAVSVSHRERVKAALKDVGVGKLGIVSQEGRYLPRIIHQDETIGGAVYGWLNGESVMLIATDRRVLFIDKKPLFIHEDEITYDVVSGVSFSHAGLGSLITLHTRIRDYAVRTYNQKALQIFVDYIEKRCLDSTEVL